MRFLPTAIQGLVIVDPEPLADERGVFYRTFCEKEFKTAGIDFRVKQANISRNTRCHTLRGLHFQRAPFGEPKIVTCVKGRVFDVAVDLREDSETYLQWESVILDPEGGRMVYLAEGLAHGFLTLEPGSEVHYLMGADYRPEYAHGLRWDDPAIGIDWPASPAMISDRDASYRILQESAPDQ